jgi:hypothetical protein
MFHQAVKPLSRLPWWGYDLDRSASRLRVASTPAPVGFVETLCKVPEQAISEGAQDVGDNIKNDRSEDSASTEYEERLLEEITEAYTTDAYRKSIPKVSATVPYAKLATQRNEVAVVAKRASW